MALRLLVSPQKMPAGRNPIRPRRVQKQPGGRALDPWRAGKERNIPLTKDKCLKIAMRQSALELGCRAEDFVCGENIALPAAPANPAARRYLSLPQDCALVSYGTNVVAAASDRLLPDVREYISRYAAAHCFETPNLLVLEDALRAHGFRVCFMAEYFLPDPARLDAGACGFSIREMHPLDFAPLYLPEWSNALCSDRRDLDVLGMGAYDGDCLVGLAACSADCADMWQIGVDVLPAYRLRGIASTLTARLALAVLARGKVPFYCAAWSNLRSVRNALRSGFFPAWAELAAKPAAFVERMNQESVRRDL